MFVIGLLTGKVDIGIESRLKINYAKEKTDELRPEEENITDGKVVTTKLIDLAGINVSFEGIRCDV